MGDWENKMTVNHTTDYSQNWTMFINQNYNEMRETLVKDILRK